MGPRNSDVNTIASTATATETNPPQPNENTVIPRTGSKDSRSSGEKGVTPILGERG